MPPSKSSQDSTTAKDPANENSIPQLNLQTKVTTESQTRESELYLADVDC